MLGKICKMGKFEASANLLMVGVENQQRNKVR